MVTTWAERRSQLRRSEWSSNSTSRQQQRIVTKLVKEGLRRPLKRRRLWLMGQSSVAWKTWQIEPRHLICLEKAIAKMRLWKRIVLC